MGRYRIVLTCPDDKDGKEAAAMVRGLLPEIIRRCEAVGLDLSPVEVVAHGLAVLSMELDRMEKRAAQLKKKKEGGLFDA